MKFLWFSEEVEEIRQAAFKEGQNTGYQQGYQTMLERANQALDSYYKMVFALVNVQNLDLGPIPSPGDSSLDGYLNQVLSKVIEPFALYPPAKKEIASLKEVIASQEQEIKYLNKCKREAENQLMEAKRECTTSIEDEKQATKYEVMMRVERIGQLEKIVAELQNQLDWKGNKSGQQTG